MLLWVVCSGVVVMVEDWVNIVVVFKGFDVGYFFWGEEWFSGLYSVFGVFDVYIEILMWFVEGINFFDGIWVDCVFGGWICVYVFFLIGIDCFLLFGFMGEVWLEFGVMFSMVCVVVGLV